MKRNLKDTKFSVVSTNDYVESTCPWGNRVRCHEAGEARFGAAAAHGGGRARDRRVERHAVAQLSREEVEPHELGVAAPGLARDGDRRLAENYTAGGVNLSIPVYAGGRLQSERRAAEAKARFAQFASWVLDEAGLHPFAGTRALAVPDAVQFVLDTLHVTAPSPATRDSRH